MVEFDNTSASNRIVMSSIWLKVVVAFLTPSKTPLSRLYCRTHFPTSGPRKSNQRPSSQWYGPWIRRPGHDERPDGHQGEWQVEEDKDRLGKEGSRNQVLDSHYSSENVYSKTQADTDPAAWVKGEPLSGGEGGSHATKVCSAWHTEAFVFGRRRWKKE